ncbi:hypothetical protein HPB52_008557 [Rhipicephalus sanguineus]|uniref:CCHC-type domain-containing protein n=1 Tax=Rhipicephalus sanguineus TaxID=34632 RepID=A0A9D4SU14_RHISA|nr:hypothetical protein HPB52_008557 [Rhipicephalus sanguineus]
MGPVLRQRPRPAGAAMQPRAVSDPSTTGDTSAQQAGTPPSATFASFTNTALRQQSHEPATPAQPNKPIHERETSQTSTSSPAATEETEASTASSSSWEHATPPSSPATPVASSEAGSSRSFTASPSISPLSVAVTAAPVLPAAAVTGPNTPAATSAPQGFEQPTTSSRPFLSQRCDQATPMPCPNTSGHTIIFRPVGKKTHFLAVSRDNIASFLSGFPATRRVRVNYRRNLVAVDTHQASDPTSLLQVAVICDVKVRSKILTTNTCVGLVFGVDSRFDAESISANISSSVPVTSCVRRGKCLTITFEGTTVPKEIFLYKQRRLVRPRLPRPLQCTRCGRYGHATATCSLDERCLRCGANPRRRTLYSRTATLRQLQRQPRLNRPALLFLAASAQGRRHPRLIRWLSDSPPSSGACRERCTQQAGRFGCDQGPFLPRCPYRRLWLYHRRTHALYNECAGPSGRPQGTLCWPRSPQPFVQSCPSFLTIHLFVRCAPRLSPRMMSSRPRDNSPAGAIIEDYALTL